MKTKTKKEAPEKDLAKDKKLGIKAGSARDERLDKETVKKAKPKK